MQGMLTMETRDFSQQEWHDLVEQFSDTSLLQLWEYAVAKQELQGWEVQRHVFRDGEQIVGAAQAMVKRLPVLGRGLVWINRAPLCQLLPTYSQRDVRGLLIEMMEQLKRYWVGKRGMYLRIATPALESPELRVALQSVGFRYRPDSAWVSARVDLRQSVEVLRANLAKKWRNCLKKAEGLGLSCLIGSTSAETATLCEDYEIFLKTRIYPTTVTADFLRCLQRLLPEDRKLWVFEARRDMEHLGSILVAAYNTTVEYLVGAVNEQGKALNAGQYLLWNAMLEGKSRGFRFFDLGGMHPEKTPSGIFHFKQGIGGTPYRLVGEFEAVGGLSSQAIQLLLRIRRM